MREKIVKELKKVNLIENNVVVNYEVLHEFSTCPETLNVVESRQYRERGLLHISDATYSFFLLLEQERVDRINVSKLATLQEDMVDESIREVKNCKRIYSHFESLFDAETAVKKVRIRW